MYVFVHIRRYVLRAYINRDGKDCLSPIGEGDREEEYFSLFLVIFF